MSNFSRYNTPEYGGFLTDPRILYVLEKITGTDLLNPESRARYLWVNGIAAEIEGPQFFVEIKKICQVGEVLYWGEGNLEIVN